MPRRVLISFVGTGQIIETQTRQYRTATYKADGKEYNFPFVSIALKQHYEIDSVILIGTPKSIWESVYLEFAKVNGKDIDEDYYLSLGTECEKKDHTSPLTIPDQKRIEDVLGPGSKIILINYGLTQEELQQNEEKILSIDQLLRDGDELYVDITHSFRSLPLILLNTIIYLKEVSSKNVKIQKVVYGMLDVHRELGYAPIVELNNILEVNDWISGAHALKEYGNGYRIVELLKDDNNKQKLQSFSDLLNTNYLAGIRSELGPVGTQLNYQAESPFAKKVLKPVMDSFRKSFQAESDSKYQLSLAKWHFDHHNYGSAYLILQECIISYMCEKHRKYLPQSYDEARDLIRDCFNKRGTKEVAKLKKDIGPIPANIRKTYHDIRVIRNCIAHTSGDAMDIEAIIKRLQKGINIMDSTINNQA